MTDYSKITKANLEATLADLEGLVAKHGAECVGAAFSGLLIKNRAVLELFAHAQSRATAIVLEAAGQTCQCEKCRAGRAQA